MVSSDDDGPKRPPSLADLKARLTAARKARNAEEAEREKSPQASMSGLALGWRLIAEMASAIVVGGLIGWYLDSWLGSAPWILLGGLMLGIVTGIWNVWRTIQRLEARQAEEEAAAQQDENKQNPDA